MCTWYPFVARNHGGIPFSGVCPNIFNGTMEKILTIGTRYDFGCTENDVTGQRAGSPAIRKEIRNLAVLRL